MNQIDHINCLMKEAETLKSKKCFYEAYNVFVQIINICKCDNSDQSISIKSYCNFAQFSCLYKVNRKRFKYSCNFKLMDSIRLNMSVKTIDHSLLQSTIYAYLNVVFEDGLHSDYHIHFLENILCDLNVNLNHQFDFANNSYDRCNLNEIINIQPKPEIFTRGIIIKLKTIYDKIDFNDCLQQYWLLTMLLPNIIYTKTSFDAQLNVTIYQHIDIKEIKRLIIKHSFNLKHVQLLHNMKGDPKLFISKYLSNTIYFDYLSEIYECTDIIKWYDIMDRYKDIKVPDGVHSTLFMCDQLLKNKIVEEIDYKLILN